MATRQQKQKGLSPAAQRAKERAKKREQERSGMSYLNLGNKKFEFFKPEEKTHILDIIPFKVKTPDNIEQIPVGDLWYQRIYKRHGGVGANNQSIVCPTMFGKPCPICQAVERLKKDYEENKDLIREIKAKDRTLMFVIDREKKSKGIQLFELSSWAFSDRIAGFIDAAGDDGLWSFFELDGKTLRVKFDKKSIGQKGSSFEASAIFFKDRQAYDASILKKTVDLLDDSIFEVLPYDQLRKLYTEDEDYDSDEEPEDGNDPVDEDDEEEDEDGDIVGDDPDADEDDEGDDQEEEEEPDEDEGDDEEPEEPEEEEVDEDDDEPEEEEEEPEPPKKSGKGKGKSTSKKASSKSGKSKTPKCPGGGTFGKDNDDLDECDECDLWEECNAAQQKKK